MAQRVFEPLGDADIIHDEARGLVAEHAVDAGDGLHEPVALHRLVEIHRVHAGRIEARQPHVADNDQFQLSTIADWQRVLLAFPRYHVRN